MRLVMEDEAGKLLRNEHAISDATFKGKLMQFHLEPKAAINPTAEEAILAADIVVLAPGDLYTSLAPALLVNGVSKALGRAEAKVVYVCNLVTTFGQTDEFAVHDFANEIERFIGTKRLDYVLYNTKAPSEELLKRYAKEKEFGVKVDEAILETAHYQAIGAELISETIQAKDPHDTLFQRTYIRHDGEKVAKQLLKLYFR